MLAPAGGEILRRLRLLRMTALRAVRVVEDADPYEMAGTGTASSTRDPPFVMASRKRRIPTAPGRFAAAAQNSCSRRGRDPSSASPSQDDSAARCAGCRGRQPLQKGLRLCAQAGRQRCSRTSAYPPGPRMLGPPPFRQGGLCCGRPMAVRAAERSAQERPHPPQAVPLPVRGEGFAPPVSFS